MSMEQIHAQVRALTDELGLLKAEIVQVKSVHANLHQQAVEAGAQNNRQFTEQASRIEQVSRKIENIAADAGNLGKSGGTYPKPLIEAKQVEVAKFAGGVNDDRSRFLDWVEKAKDRVGLYDHGLVAAMEKVEGQVLPITAEKSEEMESEKGRTMNSKVFSRCIRQEQPQHWCAGTSRESRWNHGDYCVLSTILEPCRPQ